MLIVKVVVDDFEAAYTLFIPLHRNGFLSTLLLKVDRVQPFKVLVEEHLVHLQVQCDDGELLVVLRHDGDSERAILHVV